MKVRWTLFALQRVKEIAAYIAEDSPMAARKWAVFIFKRAEVLRHFPESGRWLQEAGRSDIREIIVGNYRLAYRVDRARITILTIRNSRQEILLGEIVRAKDIQVPEQGHS